MEKEVISLRGITKVYETGKVAVHALRGVDLAIDESDFVSIMGPSGSGKSTLMHIMGCLDVPTQGHYLLEGQEVQALHHDKLAEIRNARIGFVFQSFNLLSYASARENVEVPMIFRGMNGRARRERSSELLAMVGLEDRMDHRPSELSGGEMQRVAIARAMANDPGIVLADEPTGNLDTVVGAEIIDIFVRLWKQGRTIVVITHDQGISRRTKRVVRLVDGQIVNGNEKPS